MTETEENTSIEKEKKSIKAVVIVTVALVCLIAVFAAVKVYTSPARQLQRQLDLGRRYLEEMDYEQAIVAFDKVIEIDPKNADAYLGKADAYIGLGDSAMAAENLEKGYQVTEGDEAIKDRLLSIYAKIAEDEIETGLYEEGKKAYERIVELGGENKEIQAKLEELQDGGNKEDIAQVDEQEEEEEEEEELPYYKLGFSPEDFTLAGYSIMDGDHLEDIVSVVAAEIPYLDDVWEDENYKGWYREEFSNEKSLLIGYMYDDSIIIDGNYPIEYLIESEKKIVLNIGADPYDLYEYNGWPTDMLSKRPFYEGSVITGVSSYEDVTNTLGIREVLQEINERNATFLFESQYGNTKCWWDYYENSPKSCSFLTNEWILTLVFGDDDVLHGIKVESL